MLLGAYDRSFFLTTDHGVVGAWSSGCDPSSNKGAGLHSRYISANPHINTRLLVTGTFVHLSD